jgi:hypothetical protein
MEEWEHLEYYWIRQKRKYYWKNREWRTTITPLNQTTIKNTTKSKTQNNYPILKIPQIKIPSFL